MGRTVVVVPNHLPHLDFLREWPELAEHQIIVMQDIGDPPRDAVPPGFDVTFYTHDDVRAELGDNDWIIPSRTSACRSYGYLKAWQRRPDIIITLDNDCYPDAHGSYWVDGHRMALGDRVTLDWVNTIDWPYARGHPYGIRDSAPVMLNHGLWSGVPDLDAPTSLHNPALRLSPAVSSQVVPRWNFFPMCGMNLAWRAELTPAMYFGLFGPAYGFDQYDDIWAGVLVKKVLDHLGMAVRSGYPSVEHRKQSNVYVNLVKQAPGMAMNEEFWRAVQRIELTADSMLDAYTELIAKLPDRFDSEPEGWTAKFKEAALIWVSLFR